PDEDLIKALKSLPKETSLVSDNHVLISHSKDIPLGSGTATIKYDKDYLAIDYLWELFQNNGKIIGKDFDKLVNHPSPKRSTPGVHLIGAENIYIEESASVTCATINATAGPVYIGKDVTVMEGTHIYGPVVLNEGAVVKMGAKI